MILKDDWATSMLSTFNIQATMPRFEEDFLETSCSAIPLDGHCQGASRGLSRSHRYQGRGHMRFAA